MNEDRIEALDLLRGLAVIGILLGNVAGFALPPAASLHPFGPGHAGLADQALWGIGLLLIDGKMRAIFAMLFGAAMLLSLEQAALDGRDGPRAYRARMLVLLPIGLLHALLLDPGALLMLLAVAGLIAPRFARQEPLALLKTAAGLIALQLLVNAALVTPPFVLRTDAAQGGAALAWWQAAALGLDSGGPAATLADRLAQLPREAFHLGLVALPEVLGFLALGMAMLKGGFLAAQWPPESFRQTARHGLRIGLIGTGLLLWWTLWSADPLVGQAVALAAALPLRVPLAVAYAALAMAMVAEERWPAMRARFVAVGRLALTNALLGSFALAFIFAPWGLSLFGRLGRPELWLIAGGIGALLLAWSPWWLRRRSRGPVETLWRALARRLG